MFEVHVTMTGKSYSPKDEYRIFAEDKHIFLTRGELDAWIRRTYGTCKREPMYTEVQDGPDIRAGWVFGFRNADLSHAPVQHWLQQDWVSIYELTPVTI